MKIKNGDQIVKRFKRFCGSDLCCQSLSRPKFQGNSFVFAERSHFVIQKRSLQKIDLNGKKWHFLAPAKRSFFIFSKKCSVRR